MEVINSELLKNDGMDIRKEVLRNALILEKKASIFIAELLRIDLDKSKILNGTGSIDFNKKIYLLVEIGALKEDSKSKFIAFMECRNKFMHDININTFEKCFPLNEKGTNYLLKNYVQSENLDIETKLKNAFTQLTDDVLNSIDGIVEYINQQRRDDFDKNYKMYQLEYDKLLNENYLEQMAKHEKMCKDLGKEFNVADFFKYYGDNIETIDKSEFQKKANDLKIKYRKIL